MPRIGFRTATCTVLAGAIDLPYSLPFPNHADTYPEPYLIAPPFGTVDISHCTACTAAQAGASGYQFAPGRVCAQRCIALGYPTQGTVQPLDVSQPSQVCCGSTHYFSEIALVWQRLPPLPTTYLGDGMYLLPGRLAADASAVARSNVDIDIPMSI